MSNTAEIYKFPAQQGKQESRMAELENGYLRLANQIQDALCIVELSGREFRVLNAIVRLTYGWSKKSDRIANSLIADKTTLKVKHVSEAVLNLAYRNIIILRRIGQTRYIGINTNLDKWAYAKPNCTKCPAAFPAAEVVTWVITIPEFRDSNFTPSTIPENGDNHPQKQGKGSLKTGNTKDILPKTNINTDLTQPKPFPAGRDFREYVAGVLEGKLSGASALEFHDSAIATLQAAGLDVHREYPVPERGDGREGRIDIVVTDGNGTRCGIELDRISPRQKSLLKLGAVESGICVLRRGDIARRTEQGVLIIGGSKSAKKDRAARFDPLSIPVPEWLDASSWSEWVAYRQQSGKAIKTELTVTKAFSLLKQCLDEGHDPVAVINASIANGYQGLFKPKFGLSSRNAGRDVNRISQPDKKIPTGFRG
ncbi:replication protein [Bacillus amyloliquefaciens]|nr:replication protein [Bacillus amyloliquefaciens]